MLRSSRVKAWLACVLLCGCGRWFFDPLDDAHTGATADVPVDTYGGPAGMALSLDGTAYAVSDNICDAIAPAFTMTGWVRPAVDQMDPDSTCLVAINGTGGANYMLLMYQGIERHFGYYDDFFTNRVQNMLPVVPDQWHFVAVTLDASGSGVVYVNGAVTDTVQTPRVVATPCRLSIGQEWDAATPTDQFVGLVDNFAFWDVAKSQAEIQAVMAANLVGDEPGLVAYFTFEQGGHDDSGHGNDTTFVGATVVTP